MRIHGRPFKVDASGDLFLTISYRCYACHKLTKATILYMAFDEVVGRKLWCYDCAPLNWESAIDTIGQAHRDNRKRVKRIKNEE